MNIDYICPMCRKQKHKLCAPSWCGCSHPELTKDNRPAGHSSVYTVSGGLPTLGKGHK